MTSYKTKQRGLLVEFFNTSPHISFSAQQISNHFQDMISPSAVYRNLSQLEADGKIRKISKQGSREIFYQFTEAKSCENQIHLVCEKCDKITHANTATSKDIVASLKNLENFAANKKTTIIYGICKKCNTN